MPEVCLLDFLLLGLCGLLAPDDCSLPPPGAPCSSFCTKVNAHSVSSTAAGCSPEQARIVQKLLDQVPSLIGFMAQTTGIYKRKQSTLVVGV
jgi:hypothetical protein